MKPKFEVGELVLYMDCLLLIKTIHYDKAFKQFNYQVKLYPYLNDIYNIREAYLEKLTNEKKLELL